MKISGFTFLRNASKLYFPFKESILSILPLVDEYIIMLGLGDEDDHTEEIIHEINSPKIKVFHSIWDTVKYPNGSEYAHQTDLAKEKCQGDWLIYLQGDEVIHEDDHELIKVGCEKYITDQNVEGFVFDFLHFWGDYDHYFSDHTWYRKEIRIIRNASNIHSWRDAQSFRLIANFKNNDYFRIKNTRPLNCIDLNARVFHYGWVRPPSMMASKNHRASQIYNNSLSSMNPNRFDYGRMDRTKDFKLTHPDCMNEKMHQLDWQNQLRTSGPNAINRSLMKHEKLKYRILRFIEEKILGRSIGGFKNYRAILK